MTEQSPNQAKVLTVSDSVEAGNRPDVSGNALVARLTEAGYEVIEHRVVSDDVEEITNALSYMAYGFNGLVVTTGGSGFGQRDFTPEATKRVLDRAHIPAVIGGDEDVLASEEADELVRVATAIAEPGDGSAVRSMLATRLWGGTASEVASRSVPPST